jgi:imidazolonepropionase-like amidohydrolase
MAWLRILLAWTILTAAMPAAARDVAVVGARLYAAPDAAAIDDSVVLIHDGRIAGVGRRGTVAVPDGAETIDARGKVLTAGFWNSHVHLLTDSLLAPDEASDAALGAALTDMFTRWGFTTIFDLASTMQTANAIRTRIAAGRVKGPRILTVGEPFYPAGGTPVYARPFYADHHLPSAEIRSTAEAVARVGRQVRDGADGIKLFTGAIVGGETGVLPMPAAQVRAIADEAHRLGRPVFAHPTDEAGVRVAVENGVDILAHGAPLMGPWPADFARDLARRHVALIPTLSLFEHYPAASTPVPTAVQQVRALSRAGGDILFGTDAGFMDLYDTSAEYRLLAGALDWRGILAALTTTPARRFGESASRGRVAPGMAADLVLLDGDPARDAIAFAHVWMTLKDGRTIYRADD